MTPEKMGGSQPEPNSDGGLPPLFVSQLPALDSDVNTGVIEGMFALVNQADELMADNRKHRAENLKLHNEVEALKAAIKELKRPAGAAPTPHEPGYLAGRRKVRKRIVRLEQMLVESSDDMKDCVYLQIEATIVLMTGLMVILSDPQVNAYFTSVCDNDRCNLDPIEAFLDSKDLAAKHVDVLFDFMKELHLLGKESSQGTVAKATSGAWSVKVFNPQMKTFHKVFLAAEGVWNPDCFYPVGLEIADPAVSCELPVILEEWQTSLALNVDEILVKHGNSGLVEGDTRWRIFKNVAERRGVVRTIGQTDLTNILSGTANPQMKAVVNIAKVLGVTMSQLLRRNDG